MGGSQRTQEEPHVSTGNTKLHVGSIVAGIWILVLPGKSANH